MPSSDTPLHYVRRREKTFGPFTTQQILKGKAQAKFIDSDRIATSQDGPWSPIAAYLDALQQAEKQEPSASSQTVASTSIPPVVNIPTAGRPAAPSGTPWKLTPARVIAVCAAGLAALMGLFVVFVMALAMVSSGKGEPDAVAAAGDGTNALPASEHLAGALGEDVAGAAEDTGLAADKGDTGEHSVDDLLNVMRELQAALEPSSSTSDSAAVDAAPGSDPAPSSDAAAGSTVNPAWESELSEELRALSAEEATEMASRFLQSAEREANGRTTFLLLSKASAEGNGRAMYLLFLCYYQGIGVAQDQSTALQWLDNAAKAGDPAGMLAYSTAIRKGMYAGIDPSEAQMWLNRSASVGHPEAINELKRQQVVGALGVLGAVAAAAASETNSEPSEYMQACNERTFLGRPCPCDGFKPLLNGDRWDTTRCGDCLHDKSSHNIEQ